MADDNEELEARIGTLNIENEKDEDLSEEDDWEQLEERLEEEEEATTTETVSREEQRSEKRNALKGLLLIT